MKFPFHYSITLTALLAALLSCTGDSPTEGEEPGPPRPALVEKAGGDGQRGAPAGFLPESLAVRVTAADGRPVPGATVAWSVAAGGGTLSAASTPTDSAGRARVRWTLGAAGPGAVTATVAGAQPVTFTATAIPVATITLSHTSVGLGRGETLRLMATPRAADGNPLPDRPVKWSVSTPSTASVDDAGLVTGVAYGEARVTATSEGQSASVAVTVNAEDRLRPKVTGLSFAPASVDVTSASATVEISVSASDAGSGVESYSVAFESPTQRSAVGCGSDPGRPSTLLSGTAANGTWRCRVTIPRGATPGAWVVYSLSVGDSAKNSTHYRTAELQAEGLPTTLTVVNSAPPALPQLTGLAFSPTRVDVSTSDDTVVAVFAARAGAGVKEVHVILSPTRTPTPTQIARCHAGLLSGGTARDGIWRCPIPILKSSAAGTWSVSTLWVADSLENRTVDYDAARLVAAGFPGSFQVVSQNEDVTAPTLAALSVSPTTVSLANGAAVVTFTITGTDAGTGMAGASAGLGRPGTNSSYGCQGLPAAGPSQGTTFRCSVPIPAGAPAGAWPIDLSFWDVVGNHRGYTAADLQAAGFPYEVTVTR